MKVAYLESPSTDEDLRAIQNQLRRQHEKARRRLPRLVRYIERLTAPYDPLEILSQLHFGFFYGSSQDFPDMDKLGEYQFYVEILSWILLRRPFPEGDLQSVDGGILEPLEHVLKQYRETYSTFLFPIEEFRNADSVEVSFRHQLLVDFAFVRGEGLWEDIEDFAKGIYGPHAEWMKQKYGFTIDDAFQIQRAIISITEEKFELRRQANIKAEKRARINYERLLAANPETLTKDSREARTNIERLGIEEAIKRYRLWIYFGNSKTTLGVKVEEIVSHVNVSVNATIVENFLTCMSWHLGAIRADPDPTGVHPLVIRPFIEHGGIYYLPIPSLLSESLLNRFYYDLIQDPLYRDTFDEARSDWLEKKAVETFRFMLPQAKAHWGLKYGPDNTYEIDGLILYDNKLLLVEAKWKTLTVAARQGDVLRAVDDMEKAVVEPYRQARRAKEFILEQEESVFMGSEGQTFVVRRNEIQHYILVTILGKGTAVADLAVNLPILKHFGFFSENDFPWAIPLMDLSIVAELLESPSELFDYLRRRDLAMRDGRFHFHDEWDILGHYFKGYLDPTHPEFKDVGRIFMVGMDTDIDQYRRSKRDDNLPRVDKPRRGIPEGIISIIRMIESLDNPRRTDWTVGLLSVPDEVLEKIDEGILAMTEKTHSDHKLHAMNLTIIERDFGFSFVSTYRYERSLIDDLGIQCTIEQEQSKVRLWLGLAVDTSCTGDWVSLFYNEKQVNG